ncbi:MAG: ferredoxin [Candidatus Solibacter sp.]|nr:ferredoxin [Candidatus Solibacter sp.]
MEDTSKAARTAAALGVGKLKRHIFVCADQTNPKCCAKQAGLASWERLKSRLAELGMDKGEGAVFRTKANCLRICEQGPVAVVYPEGIWYHSVTPEVVDQIIEEHLAGGRPVEEYILARDPLTGDK